MSPTFGLSSFTRYRKMSSLVGELPLMRYASPPSVSPSTSIFVFVRELSRAQLYIVVLMIRLLS